MSRDEENTFLMEIEGMVEREVTRELMQGLPGTGAAGQLVQARAKLDQLEDTARKLATTLELVRATVANMATDLNLAGETIANAKKNL